MKTMKTFSVTLAMLLLACSLSGFSHAYPIDIAPMWLNVSVASADLSFSGTTAYCGASITGLTGTTSIVATTKLYESTTSGWTLRGTWNNSSNARVLACENTYSVKRGSLYKLEVSAVVTRNGIKETVTASIQKTCP